MSKRIEKQQEYIKTLLELAKENPELEILPLVDTECVHSDDFCWWIAEWGFAKVDEIYRAEERVYCKSHDYDTLFDETMDEIADGGNCTDELDLEIQAKARVDGYEWEKVITVRIRPN